MWRSFFLMVLAVAVASVGCAASSAATQRPSERLYLAVEVTQNGKRVAAPKLLGFEGHNVIAERRAPGAATADYRLLLKPEEYGGRYDVALELMLPSGQTSGRLGLLHGEERTIRLDAQTELSLMLMRVDSPEFRALMQYRQKPAPSRI